jgi:Rod binding domain-containing protein
MSTGVPPIDPAALPADVRNASPARRGEYAAAMNFERQLVEQLTKSMTESVDALRDESQDGESAATKTYRDMLPGTLADAIESGGGIGLARVIYDAGQGAQK